MIANWMRRLLARPALPAPAPDPDPMDIIILPPVPGKRGSKKRMQRRWMQDVQVGDVLESPGGSHRVVRKVRRAADGGLCSLHFSIKHCSWTRRPYTIYSFTDLRIQGWRPTGVRLTLDADIDCWLQADIADPYGSRRVTCCEAKDIP